MGAASVDEVTKRPARTTDPVENFILSMWLFEDELIRGLDVRWLKESSTGEVKLKANGRSEARRAAPMRNVRKAGGLVKSRRGKAYRCHRVSYISVLSCASMCASRCAEIRTGHVKTGKYQKASICRGMFRSSTFSVGCLNASGGECINVGSLDCMHQYLLHASCVTHYPDQPYSAKCPD